LRRTVDFEGIAFIGRSVDASFVPIRSLSTLPLDVDGETGAFLANSGFVMTALLWLLASTAINGGNFSSHRALAALRERRRLTGRGDHS
jgi:hypothetical protein